MRREFLLAGAMAFGAAGCADATVNGATFSEGCIDHTVVYNLKDGQSFRVGVSDASFESGKVSPDPLDSLVIARHKASLEIDGSGDDTRLTYHDVETRLGDGFNLALSPTEQEGTLSEEGQQVDIIAKLTADDIAVVGLVWKCDSRG